jgi:hypothetical protein
MKATVLLLAMILFGMAQAEACCHVGCRPDPKCPPLREEEAWTAVDTVGDFDQGIGEEQSDGLGLERPRHDSDRP